MNTYPVGSIVTVTIPFLDLNSNVVSPVGMTLSYQVLDAGREHRSAADGAAEPTDERYVR